MCNEFYELIPARASVEKPAKSSEKFIEFLDKFLSLNTAINDYSLSATTSSIYAILENKKLSQMRKSQLDSLVTLFLSLITDRGLLFQQTRERGELEGKRRSHRNLSLHRNGVSKNNLDAYGPTPHLARQSAVHFVFERYRDERLRLAKSALENCHNYKQQLEQFEDELDSFLDPIKSTLKEIIESCVSRNRKVGQLYGSLLNNQNQSSMPIDDIALLIRCHSSTSVTLSPKQIEFLVETILPAYIKEEHQFEEFKSERIQPRKLSLELSESQRIQFLVCSSNRDLLQKQWNDAIDILSNLHQTYDPSSFRLVPIPLYKDSTRSVLPSDFSPYLKFTPLAQLVINYRYLTAIDRDDLQHGVKLILDKPNKLGKAIWHSWRPARRNAVLVRELVALLKKKEIDPESAEGLAQIDALLFFTGFVSHVLQHPKSLDAFVHALTSVDDSKQTESLSSNLAGKLLICRILTEIRMCVDYTITDCLCFDPTLFLQVECPPADSNHTDSIVDTNVPAYEKLLRWVNHPTVSLSGLKRLKITDESFMQFRQLFEDPATSRDTMRNFLLPICDEFNWDSIQFPPLKKFIKRPIYYNRIALLLTEYAFLMKLSDETRTELIKICKMLIDFTAGNSL